MSGKKPSNRSGDCERCSVPVDLCDCFEVKQPHVSRVKDEHMLDVALEDVDIPADWVEGW